MPTKELVEGRTPTRPPLWPHQEETLRRMTLTDRLFDCSDPGTGKTRVQIEAISKRGAKSLILAPKTLLESAWGYDIRKYAPHLFYTCAYARNREQAFDTDMQVYITNTDAVNWLAKKPRAWFRKTFGDDAMLIIDESTAFKHRTSLRSKAIARIAPYFKYRSGLTGTPNPNSVTELWHQVKLLDDGVRLGHSFFGFRAQCCTPEQVGPSANHIKWYDKAGIEEVVGYMLKDIVVRHRFDDVMNIPENYMRKIEFKLGNRTREIYQELEDFAYVQLMEQDNITAVNAAVLRNKLLQIASGAVYTEAGYKVLDPQRYDLVMDLVEERDHSIVFFNWAHQRDQLIKVAEKRGISYGLIDGTVSDAKRTAVVESFQAGLLQTVLLHPQTGAHGLTLTRGRATIWCSPVYQADFLVQGKHRIVRGGQDKKTETILICAEDTVEDLVYERVGDKTTRMSNFLEIIEERRKQ